MKDSRIDFRSEVGDNRDGGGHAPDASARTTTTAVGQTTTTNDTKTISTTTATTKFTFPSSIGTSNNLSGWTPPANEAPRAGMFHMTTGRNGGFDEQLLSPFTSVTAAAPARNNPFDVVNMANPFGGTNPSLPSPSSSSSSGPFGMAHYTSGRNGEFGEQSSSTSSAPPSAPNAFAFNNRTFPTPSPFAPPIPPQVANAPAPTAFMLHPTSGRDNGFDDINVPSPLVVEGQPQSEVAATTGAKQGATTSASSTAATLHKHEGIVCDKCQVKPIVGVRYRCSMCSNYDLCESCLIENESKAFPFHDPTHIFLRLVGNKPSIATQQSNYPVIISRSNAIHVGVTCSCCQAQDLQGYIYKCQGCPNVNLCESCECKGLHDINHTRIKIATPSVESQLLKQRQDEIAQLKEQLAAVITSTTAGTTTTGGGGLAGGDGV